MTFSQRTIQYFFLFLGLSLAFMFIVRGVAPNSRFVLWQVLCPPKTHIELAPGLAEINPGEVVSAYEVVCVGENVRQPLSDIQISTLEFGFPIGLALGLALLFGWFSTRKVQNAPRETAIL